MRLEELQNAVDAHRAQILEAERWLWRHPATGYREWEASRYLEDAFQALGYATLPAGDIPGFRAVFDTGCPGPTVLVMAELDSLLCEDHPEANPETHAVHACGHHAQCAALLGLAAALREEGVTRDFCGRVLLCLVPAEELIETEYRETLRQAGTIRYFGGKVEFLYRGYFDQVDMAFMVHTSSGDKQFFLGKGGNGCVVKNIAFRGHAAHAGGSPHKGINALYAATLGMNAINALRETFRDEDHIRVHPILTGGGTVVNAIPSAATMQSYVRGANMEAILDANRRVNRALAASAAAMGANVEICDRPGYAPLFNDPTLRDIARRAMLSLAPISAVEVDDTWDTGCTDMGDISSVMPAIHAVSGGASGTGHGNDYRIADPERACVNSAKLQLTLLWLLLKDGGAEAKRVLENAKPRYESAKAYFEAVDGVIRDGLCVRYEGAHEARLSF